MNRWLVRIGLGIVAVLIVGVIGVAGLIAWDSVSTSQRVEELSNVTFAGENGQVLHGYLAEPEDIPAGGGPAILLVHEFFGLNEDIIAKAEKLADQGYTVLAADAYRGQTTSLIPRAIYLVVSTPRQQIANDLDAAFQYLSALNRVNPEAVGAVGFCFGGTQVMHLATRQSDLAATVIYYGSGPLQSAQELGVMAEGGPVLGIYGETDNSIPVTEVRAFEDAMRTGGVEHQVTIYPGVGHAFVDSENIEQPGPARDAWQQMLRFLGESLKGETQ